MTSALEISQTDLVNKEVGETLRLRPGMDAASLPEHVSNEVSSFVSGEKREDVEVKTLFEVVRERCFLNAHWTVHVQKAKSGLPVPLSRISMSSSSVWLFKSALLRLIHLPGLRGSPERAYARTGAGPLFPGTFPTYAASVIAKWQDDHDDRLGALGADLERMGLGWKVKARRVEDIQISIHLPRLARGMTSRADDLVNIADMGIGVSQALPILVALRVADKGDMVYIEQPEIHLHPRAQVVLAEILADAAKRGVRVVAETHSSVLLLAVQALVAEGKLDPSLVKLHWFTRNEEGFTRIQSAELDKCGAFGDWPEDFGPVEMALQNRYLDAAEKCLQEG